MQPEFIIFTPEYHEQNGGSIVLHHLCHLINELGGRASVMPFFNSHRISPLANPIEVLTSMTSILWEKRFWRQPNFRVNARLKTPIFTDVNSISSRDDIVVVYPEIVAGNPLSARRVARWILHEPGFHNGEIFFTRGEVQFCFSDRFPAVRAPGLEIAPIFLNIFIVPWDLYEATPDIDRKGVAYTIRKGKGKPLVHDPADAILIDGMKSAEIAEVLKRTKTFISYDPNTMYSAFAVVAGCDSIVVPDPGVSIEAWSPNPSGRFGIAYGFEDLPRARATRSDLISALRSCDGNNLKSVSDFINFWQRRI